MAKGLNHCTFIGNLGSDVEIRRTSSGTVVGKISLAVGGRRKVGDNWEDSTEWVRCVVFGKTAEVCEQYLRKGSQVHVTGEMRTTKYQAKDGTDRWSTEIVVRDVVFLGGRGDSGSRGDSGGGSGSNSGGGYSGSGGNSDDDIPF